MPTLFDDDSITLDHDPVGSRNATLTAGYPGMDGDLDPATLTRPAALRLAQVLMEYATTPDPGPGAPYPLTQRGAALAAMSYEELVFEIHREQQESLQRFWQNEGFGYRNLQPHNPPTPAREAPATFRPPKTSIAEILHYRADVLQRLTSPGPVSRKSISKETSS